MTLPETGTVADIGPRSPSGYKLLDRVRQAVRVRHYSRRTEGAYVTWIRRFIVFHGKKHPSDMGGEEIRRYLTHLAVDQKVSGSTQNQALSALLFLYRRVLGVEPGPVDHVPHALSPLHVPVVLSVDEVRMVLRLLTGVPLIIVSLLYGAGLRLQESLELRVKDLDFDRNQIVVRRGKGQKDRRTMLPASAKAPLMAHLGGVRRLHQRDLSRGFGRVTLPAALDRKYPNAATDWGWQFVFPAARICRDPRFGPPSRYHLHESVVQRAVTAAVRGPVSRNGPAATRSGIPSRPICSRTGTTSEPSRNCSVTRM